MSFLYIRLVLRKEPLTVYTDYLNMASRTHYLIDTCTHSTCSIISVTTNRQRTHPKGQRVLRITPGVNAQWAMLDSCVVCMYLHCMHEKCVGDFVASAAHNWHDSEMNTSSIDRKSSQFSSRNEPALPSECFNC